MQIFIKLLKDFQSVTNHIINRSENLRKFQFQIQMENFQHEQIQIHAKIAAIEHSKHLTEEEKVHQISVFRSIRAQATNSTARTIWSISNCMIGSALIIYPVLFAKSGIIISPFLMVIVATIQCMTCRLLVIHNRPDEPTFNQSILRIGGVTIDKINSIANMLLFFFGCIATFMLLTNNFYKVTSSILPYNPPQPNEFVLTKYSIQWAAVIVFFIIKPMIFKRQLGPLLRLSKYAMYCVMTYLVFILLNLIRHIIEGKIHIGQFRFFNSDFSSIGGALALSFLVHPMAAPVLKKSKYLENNTRDLVFGYIVGATILFYTGFFGALSCAPEIQNIRTHPDEYRTVFDCVSPNAISTDDKLFFYFSKLIQLLISFQNFSVLPISMFMTRNQFLTLAVKPRKREEMFVKFTWFYLSLAFVITITGMDVTVLMSLNGAVVGFFISYAIPIYIHLKCLYHKYSENENKKRKSLMESLLNESVLGESQRHLQLEPDALQCNSHEQKDKSWSYALYGSFLLCGIALAIFKLLSVL